MATSFCRKKKIVKLTKLIKRKIEIGMIWTLKLTALKSELQFIEFRNQ